MGRRLVVRVVLDEGLGNDIYDSLAQLVRAARGVVAWQVEALPAEPDEVLDGTRAPAERAEAQLEAVGA
jgi:hypothetical protein